MKFAVNPITGRLDLTSVNTTITTGGATTFLQLTDTPDSYSGEELKTVRVNSTGNALEFYNQNDEKVKVNSTDTNSSYLASKITAGASISLLTLNTGSNELLRITNTSPDQIVSLTGTNGVSSSGTYPTFTVSANPSEITHSSLAGLNSDDHTQYVKNTGRAGGQTIIGGSNVGDKLILQSDPSKNSEINLDAESMNPVNDNITDLGGPKFCWPNIYISGYVRIREQGGGTHFTKLLGSPGQASDIIYAMPTASASANRQALTSDTGGQLSWNSLPPVGSVIMYGASSAPTGWLLCDGSEYATASYSNLYSTIGYSFGTGSGSNFKVPNMGLRFPKGYQTGSSVGDTGGSTSYTPSGGIDQHTYGSQVQSGTSPAFVVGPLVHTFTGTPAVIQPPYLILNFIIKY